MGARTWNQFWAGFAFFFAGWSALAFLTSADKGDAWHAVIGCAACAVNLLIGVVNLKRASPV